MKKYGLFMALSMLLIPIKTPAETLKIATWNIAWLGSHHYNRRDEQDYQALARYAKQLDADIIALQEVENADYARKVLGDDYDYYFTVRNWVQRVGVAVRKSKGFSVMAQEYKDLDVGKVRYGMDVTLTKGESSLRLLAVHLKSGCVEHKLDERSIRRIKPRSRKDKYLKVSCATLSNQTWPLERWIDNRAQEGVPFIVLGDFNRRFSQDIKLDYNETQGFWQAIDDEGAEDLWAPTLTQESKCWGGYFKDYIDHIVLSPGARKMFQENSFEQLVFDGKYSKELSHSLSDHCPISIKIDTL